MLSILKKAITGMLPKSQFGRGVSVLVGGTASSQALLILATPLLTRLYSPEDFGLVVVFSSLLALVSVVVCLRYELAIPLPETDQEAVNIAALSLLVVLFMGGISGLVVYLFGDFIAEYLGVQLLANYFWLLPLGAVLGGAYRVFYNWSIRSKQFYLISETKLSQTLTTLTIQLLGFKAGSISLLSGQVAGQGMGTVRLGKGIVSSPEFKNISVYGIRRSLVRYYKFPAFSIWSGLLNSSGAQLAPLMIAGLFGATAAGVFGLTHRVLNLPISLIGGAVSSVFYSMAPGADRYKVLSKLVLDTNKSLTQMAMPVALIISIMGPDIFLFLFGENWRQGGEWARWMAPWLLLQFISAPLATIFAAIEKQQIGLLLQGQMLLVRIVAITIGSVVGGVDEAIMFFALGSALSYVLFLMVIFHVSGLKQSLLFLNFFKELLISFIYILPALWFFDLYGVEVVYQLFLASMLVALRYANLHFFGF